MLALNPPPQRCFWKGSGIYLDLIPLPEDVDQEFIANTTTHVMKKGRIVRIERDSTKYAQLVGCYCIKRWGGVVGYDSNGDVPHEVECIDKNINEFMRIDVAQAFVFSKIKGLVLHMVKEIKKAKKDLERSQDGTATAEAKRSDTSKT